MRDYLFLAIVGGFCPAVLCAVARDGAGLLFIWLFIGVCGLGALACWALVLNPPGGDA